MIAECFDHLWQSTAFAVVVGLLATLFRRNQARVRFMLWFSASCKFLLPFSLLRSIGAQLWWDRLPVRMVGADAVVQIVQPFASAGLVPLTGQRDIDWAPIAVGAIWALGFAAVVLVRCREWLRVRSAVRRSRPTGIVAAVEIRSCSGLSAPAIVGVLRPVVLVPESILEMLLRPQLKAVLEHEKCHARRRDNLLALVHMSVEALFWFHPLVWWIGARLLDERERACDEEVVRVTGEPEAYAEAIVMVCKHGLIPAHGWVSALTGAELKARIRDILAQQVPERLTPGRRLLLAAVGCAVMIAPIAMGGFARQINSAKSVGGPLQFKTASIRPTAVPGEVVHFKLQRGALHAKNVSARFLVREVFHTSCGIPRIVNEPDWFDSARYDIDAEPVTPDIDLQDASFTSAEHNLAWGRMQGRIRTMLEARFGLKVRYQVAPSQVCYADPRKKGQTRNKAGVLVIVHVQMPSLNR